MTCNNQQDPEADQQPKTTTAEGSQLATNPRDLEASNNKPSMQIISPGSRNRKQQTNKAITATDPRRAPRRGQASQNKATRAEGIDSYIKHRARNKPTTRPQPSTQPNKKTSSRMGSNNLQPKPAIQNSTATGRTMTAPTGRQAYKGNTKIQYYKKPK